MSHDVFISYSNTDKLTADAACATLEAAGIRCWIAPRDVSPGAEWGEALIGAIDNCAVMVLIFSSNANESRQVHREVEHAVSQGKIIMPVRIDTAQPARSLAYYMAGLHWLDALSPPLEDHLRQLVVSIKALLGAALGEPDRDAGGSPPDFTSAAFATASNRSRGPTAQVVGRKPRQRDEDPAREQKVKVRSQKYPSLRGALAVLIATVAAAVLVFVVFRQDTFRGPTAGSILSSVHAGLYRTLTGHAAQIQSIGYSPDSRILVSASLDKTIRLWDTASTAPSRTINADVPVYIVAFSPDGLVLASASQDKIIRLWDVASGSALRTISADEAVWGVAFSPDGRSLASAGTNTIKLWDAHSDRPIGTLPHGASEILFAPDGRTLAAASDTIELWDTNSDQMMFSLGGPSQFRRCIAFSPDGQTLASGDGDTVKLWDVRTGQETHSLTGHTDRVRCVTYSPNGRLLASGGWDNTIKLWDTTSYQELVTLTGQTGRIIGLAFSPDGRTLASGGVDTAIKLWSVAY
jgi:hypothetical protein